MYEYRLVAVCRSCRVRFEHGERIPDSYESAKNALIALSPFRLASPIIHECTPGEMIGVADPVCVERVEVSMKKNNFGRAINR